MEAVRDKWTDERLDDLNHRVDDGFHGMDKRFDKVETRMERQFSQVNARLDKQSGEVNERLDGIQQTMVHAIVALTAAAGVGFVTVVGLIIAQG